MRPTIDNHWIEYFQNNGYPETEGISVGMEGAVYSLVPNKVVAKVWWSGKTILELEELQTFYQKLSTFSNSIQTPKILEVKTVDDTLITVESFLGGRPLEEYLKEDACSADEKGVDATIKVLDFLRNVPAQEEFKILSVLDETTSFWNGSQKWSEAVINLLSLRYDRFGSLLLSDIPDIEAVMEAVRAFLKTRDDVQLSIIHGDLCGPNIMIDKDIKPISVFDFGFLSTVGDPAFDAGVTSSLFNMYGPHARAIDDEVTDAVVKRLGYKKDVLLSYKAAYAIISSNAYSNDRTDGHYQWCVRMLCRKDIRSSLNL